MARKKAKKANQNYVLGAVAVIAIVALVFSVVGMFKGSDGALAGEAIKVKGKTVYNEKYHVKRVSKICSKGQNIFVTADCGFYDGKPANAFGGDVEAVSGCSGTIVKGNAVSKSVYPKLNKAGKGKLYRSCVHKAKCNGNAEVDVYAYCVPTLVTAGSNKYK